MTDHDLRDLVVRVDESLKHLGRDLEEIKTRLPENLNKRLVDVETDTKSLSKWRTGIVAVGSFIVSLIAFGSEVLANFFHKGIH